MVLLVALWCSVLYPLVRQNIVAGLGYVQQHQ